MTHISIYKLIRQLCIFLVAPIISILSLFFYLNYKNNELIDKYKIPVKKTTLCIGDSHVRQCINDSIVPNCVNFSQLAESYYFSYFKIKKLISSNGSVRKIYLGYSYHNLSSVCDKYIFGKHSGDIVPKYFFILPGIERSNILKNNFGNISNIILGILKQGIMTLPFGKYESDFTNTSAKKVTMDWRLKFQFYNSNRLYDFSSFNLLYLDKIVSFCKEKNIELVLLSTPLNDYYKSRIPKPYVIKYNEIIRKYNLNVIDFRDVKFDDACFVPDGDHVSEKGATIASRYLINE